jgi:hypothetical protein
MTLVLAAALVAPGPASAATRCRAQRGERVIAHSAEALVLQGQGRVVACLRDGRRRFRLDSPASPEDPPADVDEIVLSGKFVLYATRLSIGSGGDESAGLVVTDLRTGRSPAVVAFGNQLERLTEVRASVLKRNGSFAWIQDATAQGGGLDRTVQVCTLRSCARGPSRAAAPVIVAQSPMIAARSLSRRRSRVYWVENGERRSAPC